MSKRKFYPDNIRNWNIALITFFIFCFSLFYSCKIAKAEEEVIDRIVAIVNDDVICLFELNKRFIPYAERIKAAGYPPLKKRKMLYKVRRDILNQLIDQKLASQEAKRARITISNDEIDAAIERIKEHQLLTDEEFDKLLEKDGLTREEYRQQLKDQILRTRLVNYKIKSKIVITREDIKKYYDEHKDEFSGDNRYHLRNIIISVSAFADDAEKAAARKKIEDIVQKIKAGASFAEMAKKYSQSSLAEDGGDLGEFSFKDISPELKEALNGLKPGDITPIMETVQGFQIFYVESIKKAPAKSLEEASKEIEEKLFNEVVNEKFKKWIENLRRQSAIKIIS